MAIDNIRNMRKGFIFLTRAICWPYKPALCSASCSVFLRLLCDRENQQITFPRKLFPLFLLMEAHCVFARWELTCLLPSLLTYLLTYLPTYLLTHSLTPCSRVLLQKLTGFQLVKKFPAFYGTRRFITPFTGARHMSPS